MRERISASAGAALAVLVATAGFLPPLSLAAADGPPAAAAPKGCYLAFLNKGEQRSKLTEMTKEQVEQLQSRHVGNLGELGRQGRAYTAGPLGDNGFIRGIVVLNVASQSEVNACFTDDPFVRNGILAVEAHRWLIDTSRFGRADEPFKLMKHTLGIVKKGAGYKPSTAASTPDSMLKLLPSLQPLAQSGDLAISGPLPNAGELLGALIFMGEDTAAIQAALNKDAQIRDGRVLVELHPQFLAAGVLRRP